MKDNSESGPQWQQPNNGKYDERKKKKVRKVMQSFLGYNPKVAPKQNTHPNELRQMSYRNSSIFLMIRRSFPGGGDRGSAILVRNFRPLGPSSSRTSEMEGAAGAAINPVVLGENSSDGSSGTLRTKRSVLDNE